MEYTHSNIVLVSLKAEYVAVSCRDTAKGTKMCIFLINEAPLQEDI
jgi:hypothetical protein